MQQKVDMACRYLFFVIILLVTNSLQSQTIISAGTYSAEDFTGPSLVVLVLQMLLYHRPLPSTSQPIILMQVM
jgi:hypothetical protein